MPKIRCLSPLTIDSYGQSISIYCTFLKETLSIYFSKVSFENLTRDSIINFIIWLRVRSCGTSTCNLRLSAIKSFLKYCADEDISLYSVYQEVKKIPLMKTSRVPVKYMSNIALKTLLEQPDIRTAKGFRNRMIIIFLYDTGTRVQELADIKVGDLQLDMKTPFVIVTGKGRKTRSIPLMDKTISHLNEYLKGFHAMLDNNMSKPLFYSMRDGKPHKLSTDTISVILKIYGEKSRSICPEVPQRVHPHLIRHTRAMDLYKAGMPLSYIAEFLGHVNVDTTEIYATADIEMLRNAIEKVDPKLAGDVPLWKNEETLKKLCGL